MEQEWHIPGATVCYQSKKPADSDVTRSFSHANEVALPRDWEMNEEFKTAEQLSPTPRKEGGISQVSPQGSQHRNISDPWKKRSTVLS